MIFQIDCHLFLILDCVFYFKVLCWHAYFFFLLLQIWMPNCHIAKILLPTEDEHVFRYTLKFLF